MADSFQQTYSPDADDPFEVITWLGQGGSAMVEKVIKKGGDRATCYARKTFGLKPHQRKTEYIDGLLKEARITRLLDHHHVVEVLLTYQIKNRFSIIMSPVAEQDLAELLHSMDQMDDGPQKTKYLQNMQRWPGCLIRATDYMHEMRVKHKDIKPSNILVRGRDIYITDFGISRQLAEDTDTASYITGPRTINYSAPEALTTNARKGRATDIFSLGCVFLEMGTVMVAPKGSLEEFRMMRKKVVREQSHYPYAYNEPVLLKWILNLSRLLGNSARDIKTEDNGLPYGAALPGLAFVMLDPNPKTRITGRQLVNLTANYRSMNEMSCERCRVPVQRDEHLRLHSKWKRGAPLQELTDVKDGPGNPTVPTDWVTAKLLWLDDHMWWERPKSSPAAVNLVQ